MPSLKIWLKNAARPGESISSDAIVGSRFGFHRGDRDQIIGLASRIEAERHRRLEWYTDDPIYSLGRLTAAELVSIGKGGLVVRFLNGIEYLDMDMDQCAAF